MLLAFDMNWIYGLIDEEVEVYAHGLRLGKNEVRPTSIIESTYHLYASRWAHQTQYHSIQPPVLRDAPSRRSAGAPHRHLLPGPRRLSC